MSVLNGQSDSGHDVVVWCLPGMDRARLVLRAEDGTTVARTLFSEDLIAVRRGIDEALSRIANSLCEKHGHMPLDTLGGACARCGAKAVS